MSVQWFGDRVLAETDRAIIAATDETTASAAEAARGLVHVDTALLQSRIAQVPARIDGDAIVGGFGVVDDPGYALFQEFLPEPQGKPYLRPAAAQEFPQLSERIRRRVR